jgi:hypothetical protein
MRARPHPSLSVDMKADKAGTLPDKTGSYRSEKDCHP